MCVATDKRVFVADAVFIPDDAIWKDNRGNHVDPDDCTKLMVDGDNNSANVYTEEAWNNDGESFCRREQGSFTYVEGGKVELLPELWVVKINEREHWLDEEVLAACPRIYGIYVFDRKRHVHCCSIQPSYELHFIGSDYTETDEVADDDHRSDQINQKIMEGDGICEPISYWDVHDIDRMLETEIHEGCLPPEDKHGGYRLDGIESVLYDDTIEEARESHNASSL